MQATLRKADPEVRDIKPQIGSQEAMLASSADIAVYGGVAFAGKSYALLMEPLRHIHNPGFGGVIFRRTYPQIMNEGGLWDTSMELYPLGGGVPREGDLDWTFPSGCRISFAHMQREQDRYQWDGAQIPYIAFDQLEHFCLHPETEVLTEHGWKHIGAVEKGEYVASLNKQREIEYKAVLDTNCSPFEGDLLCVDQSHGVAFRATPNHELIVETQRADGAWQRKRIARWGHDTILRTGKWGLGREGKNYHLQTPRGRGLGQNANSVKSVSMDSWLKFLGWWFSEGCTYMWSRLPQSQTPQVIITQVKHKEEVRQCLSQLPWRWHEIQRKGGASSFLICSRQLYDELSVFGKQPVRRLPRWIFDLSARQMRIFWEAFVAGDGHRTKEGGIQIGLSGEGLIDDLQEMAFLLGLIATKRFQKIRGMYDSWVLTVSRVQRQSTQVKNDRIRKEHYEGPVYCLTVEENHNFLARVRGRYFWSGNSWRQFWYLVGRNRSLCGVKPYIRCSCNPNPDHWLRSFMNWWIDDKTGLPIWARSGMIRWFVMRGDSPDWDDDPQELIKRHGSGTVPKSFTFIPGRITDNRIGLAKNPEYLGNLQSLFSVDRARLMDGNWNARETAGSYFKRNWFEIVDAAPALVDCIRYWDRAATQAKPGHEAPASWTAGVKMGRDARGVYYIADVERFQKSPLGVESGVQNTASQDGKAVRIGIEQDPGQAGKAEALAYVRRLAGYQVRVNPVREAKGVRAKELSAQAEAGNVKLVRGPWNEAFLREAEAFDGSDSCVADQVDAASGAFLMLTNVLWVGTWRE